MGAFHADGSAPALRNANWGMEDAAAMLGLSRKGLYLKRVRYGLEPPESAPQLAPLE